MKRRNLVVLVVLVLGAVVTSAGLTQMKLDALQEPGQVETFLATQIKHVLVRWSSRAGVPPVPTDLQASIEQGKKLYATDCSMCHGSDGKTPTDTGRWMYPRAADLTLPQVQGYADRELFWVIKNGIRLSGMPAFGRVESDENIWNLVNYVKTLRSQSQPQGEGD
jgi:mono/diheme cytochrome c family protein